MKDDPSLLRRQTALFDRLSAEPWAHDFFAVLRECESLWRHQPRLGSSARPGTEPVRLGQDAELDFAPAALMSFQATPSKPPRIGTRHFGLFGPMGALPLHLTEYARERQRSHGDAALTRFADVFHHRALLLFYRAWAQSQPAVQADRPEDDQFAKWVSALFGQAPAAFSGAGDVPDNARRFAAGHLSRATRSVESIEKSLKLWFGVPVRVEPHVGHWMQVRPEDRTRLGSPSNRRSAPLGQSDPARAVAGAKVWDRQYKLRLHIGPLTLAQYQRLLPGQPGLRELRGWMLELLGVGMQWDVRLILRGVEVPRLGLQTGEALGRTTWLGRRGPHGDRSDLCVRAR